MKNRYIKLQLNDKNEFVAKASFNIQGIVSSDDIKVKIDTGCSYTSIPIRRLGISDERALELKQRDSKSAANGDIKAYISFGVNDSTAKKENDKALIASKMYMYLDSVTFVRMIDNVEICGCELGSYSARVSYDRVGNILIGMDILKNWDIHIGKSEAPEDKGKTVFLACPYDKLNEDYFKELDRTFLLSTATAETKLVSEED